MPKLTDEQKKERETKWTTLVPKVVRRAHPNEPLWSLIPKRARCRLANCPNAVASTDPLGNLPPECANCSGPVVWKDPDGHTHGRARSCTGCPMNGRCLPVCYAACPGPNENYACDGQSIESIDNMANAEGILTRDLVLDLRFAGNAYGNGVTKDLNRHDEELGKDLVRAIFEMVGVGGRNEQSGKNWDRDWDHFLAAFNAKDYATAANIAKVGLHNFRNPGSVGIRLINALSVLKGSDWSIIRLCASGKMNPAQASRLHLKTKQAGSVQLIKAILKMPELNSVLPTVTGTLRGKGDNSPKETIDKNIKRPRTRSKYQNSVFSVKTKKDKRK